MSTTSEKDWSPLYANERQLETSIELIAPIVHGFKRGSKELGVPTANLDMEQLGDAGKLLDTGIYYGSAVLQGNRYEAVVSVGWNPYYKNEKKTIEAHLLANLEDFYGEVVNLTLIGFLRPEANFDSLDDLISCIKCDIDKTRERLSQFASQS